VKSVVEQEFPEKIPIRIETTETNDNRSYHVSSRKIAERLGYRPRRSIEDAVHDLCSAFKMGKCEGSLTNEDYINVKTIKKLSLQ
jgi:nucleoside-diphosphate-sugar epimerase